MDSSLLRAESEKSEATIIADEVIAEKIVGNDDDCLNKLSLSRKLSSSFWSKHNGAFIPQYSSHLVNMSTPADRLKEFKEYLAEFGEDYDKLSKEDKRASIT
jgi:hypothetical protein